MLTTNVIAIDLAKNVLQICYISVHGELLFNKAFSRQKAKSSLSTQSPPSLRCKNVVGAIIGGISLKSMGMMSELLILKK